MKPVFLLSTLVSLAATALLVAQQQPPVTPPQSQQPTDVYTKITSTGGMPPKIAIAAIIPLSTDSESVAAANTIADVLYNDIAYEREFYMIGKDAIATIPKPTSVDQIPLDRWRELNANGVIVGSVRKTGNGVSVQVKLYDVATGKMAFGKEYTGSIANPRQYAHTISDEIYQSQIALRGVARTKLTFSSDRDTGRMKGPLGPRDVQEIYIADYDGANPRRITNTTTLNITPVWAPDGQAIVYTSYRPSGSSGFSTYQDLVVSWLYKGLRDEPTHGSPSNQNYLPAWSPDGSKIAFTSNRDGNPEIYVMNRDGSNLRRMTNNPSIDVTPTWSPNGNQIAWVSDRTGSPKIHHERGRDRAAAADQRLLRPADVVHGALQRDRLRGAHRAGLRHQGLRLRDRRIQEDHRRHRQQRESGVLAQRPSYRVHVHPQRQVGDLHRRSRRQ